MRKFVSYRHPRQLTIHVVSWIFVFGFPLILMDRGSGFSLSQFVRHVSVPLCYFFVFYANYLWFSSRYLFEGRMRKYVACNVVLILCVAVLLQVFLDSVAPVEPPVRLGRVHPPRWMFVGRDVFMFVFVAWLGAAIRANLRWRKAEELLREAERQKREAELKNLKNQLNPHFLLNTLNNIYALITFDTDKAQEAVQELGKLLRYVLYDNQEAFVPLERELDFIRNYVALMRIRLAPQVKLSVRLEAGTGSLLIAPLIFISLIENAFKHGISPTAPSFISLSIAGRSDGTVRCETLNSNHPKGGYDKSGSGVGLEQVGKRLELAYPGRYEWTRGVSADGQTYSSILTIQTKEICKKT